MLAGLADTGMTRDTNSSVEPLHQTSKLHRQQHEPQCCVPARPAFFLSDYDDAKKGAWLGHCQLQLWLGTPEYSRACEIQDPNVHFNWKVLRGEKLGYQ